MATYSTRDFSFRWRPWMPFEPFAARPPSFSTSTVIVFVLASSSANLVRTSSLSPWNFWGQWHCSQVSRAGRRSFTGEWIGREWVLKVTA
jgi:hypothetical protein